MKHAPANVHAALDRVFKNADPKLQRTIRSILFEWAKDLKALKAKGGSR